MIHITDFNGDIIDFISRSDGALTEAEHMINVENKLETFDFTVLTSRTEHMQKRNRVIIEDKDGQYREFVIYNISSDLDGYTKVQTNSSALEDIKTAKPVPPHKLEKNTVKQALEFALADTGWNVSDDAEWGGTRTTSWTGWHDRISILKQLETTYKMRFSFHVEVGSNRIANRYVSLKKVEPMFNGEEIVYGDNLTELTRTVDFSDIATALICLGPEDSETGKREIVEVKDDDAQAQFGLPYRYIWDIYEPESSDENMTKKRLETLGRTALNKRKEKAISYDIKGVELSARAGDMIRVKNEDFTPELYVDAEVVEVTTDLISGDSQYKFGVIKEYTRDDIYARFNAMLSGLRERLNKVVENTDSIISERLEEELKYVERYIEKSPTPPLNPKENQLWLDTSHDGVAVLKRYENGEWVKSSVSDVKEIGGMTREETMYEALKERLVRNEVDYSEVFKRYGALVSEKHYHYVDEDIKNDLTRRYNLLQQSYDDFKIAFNNINAEQPTIGLITTAISRAVEFEARLKEYNDSYYIARKSFDEVIALLQSQYSEEKFNEAMKEVANSIGGTFDGTNIIADIPNQEDLNALNESIKQYLNVEIDSLDGKLDKRIETVVKQAKDEFSVAIESVEKKVDGIEVGNRNLVIDGHESRSVKDNVPNGRQQLLQQGAYALSESIGGYQNYSIAIKARGTGTLRPYFAATYLVGEFELTDDYQIFTNTKSTSSPLVSGINIYGIDVEEYDIEWIKVVKGNTVTKDFVPAPEVSENNINNLTQEVTKNSTSLSVLENEISLKADSNTVKQMLDSELKEVKSNVATNQSELKLLSNQISSKVEKSEYTADMNGITRNLKDAQSEREQLSDRINQKVSVSEYLNGTENLLLDSKERSDWHGNTNYQRIEYDLSKPLVAGKNYTISFKLKGDYKDIPQIRVYPQQPRSVSTVVDVVDGYGKVTWKADGEATRIFIYRGLNGRTSVNEDKNFSVVEAKMERGSFATPYEKSPEDTDNILTKHETEIEQNKLGIGTKVGYSEMNGTQKTLEKLLTEFSQTSSGFNFKIDSNGMIQDLTFDRSRFKLNSNLIEFNDGDVVIKDGRTTIKDAFIEKLKSNIITSEQVRIAYNNISNSLQITPGGLETTIEGSLASRLNSFGHHFYFKGDYIGAIGTGNLSNYPNVRGLSMTLDSYGEYLAFGYRSGNVDADDPAQVALLWSKGSGGYSRGFHFNEDIKIKHNRVIETLWLRPSNYNTVGERISFSSGQIGGVLGVSLRYGRPSGSGIHLADNQVTLTTKKTGVPGVGDFRLSFDKSGFYARSQTIYGRTYSSGANLYITSYGTIGRSTSARKYKLSIEDQFKDDRKQLEHSKKILKLNPRTWFDKTEAEIYAEELKTGEKQTDEKFTLKRHFGMIADEFEEIGMKELVSYDEETGEIEGLAYDRMPVHHNVLIKDLYKENNELKKRIEKLEELING